MAPTASDAGTPAKSPSLRKRVNSRGAVDRVVLAIAAVLMLAAAPSAFSASGKACQPPRARMRRFGPRAARGWQTVARRWRLPMGEGDASGIGAGCERDPQPAVVRTTQVRVLLA